MKRKLSFKKRLTNQSKKIAAVALSLSMAFGISGLTFEKPVMTYAAETATDLENATFSWDNATVYFLLTDRFKNGDTSNDNAYGRQDVPMTDKRATFHGGDFAGITQQIEAGYFDDLGVNAIWLTAPYEQIHGYIVGGDQFFHYSYHGYYVLDYTEPDQAYGTKQEFQKLVDTAHEHGIRIVMDVVMNHAGYNSMYDMNEYGFGTLKSGWQNYYNSQHSSTAGYHDNIDYNSSASDWGKWWGAGWIRSGLPGYTEGGNDEKTSSLSGLPDFKTESGASVGIPELLKTKWTKEGTYNEKVSKYGSSGTVRSYLTKWLSEWVETYGVDGFRCDTAKHVEFESWKALKDASNAALKKWRQNNPNKPGAQWTDDFWMTGEHWEHNVGYGKDGYFTAGGFDSMINFETQGGGLLAAGTLANLYDGYASKINGTDGFNALSYISSHDSTLADRNNLYYLGSALLMLPGGVQIYYGDETARPWVSGVSDGNGGAGHGLRSDMNWNNYDKELLTHWQKLGTFRKNHLSIGGGSNTKLTSTSGIAFGRTYNKNGVNDKAAGVVGAGNNTDITVDVSSLWEDGTTIINAYDGTDTVVNGGKVTFNSGAHGTILMEESSVAKGKVTITDVNKDTGATISTRVITGEIGQSYTASPLTTDGLKLASTTGAKTGTFTKEGSAVTFYYTFDNVNYAYVVTKFVDAATGAEVADSTTEIKKVGSTYNTTPVDVKNYEVDESQTTNASGTVARGTTTVTYKYNYVEPTTVQVHYYNDKNWASVNLYAYDESGTAVKEFTGKWPGKAMTAAGEGWFTLDLADAERATLIFNNGAGAQEPSGVGTPGYEAAGEVWIKGGKVYQTGKVKVNYVDENGKVLASETLKGVADGTSKYTTSAKTIDGYTLTTTPSNASGVFAEGTTTVKYVYKSNRVVADLKVSLAAAKTTVAPKGTVTLKATTTGGSGSYKYTYSITANGKTLVLASNSSSNTYNWTAGTSAGTKTLKVTVTDSTGKTATASTTVTVQGTVSGLSVKLAANKTTVATKGTATLTATAAGGSGSYKYTYSITANGKTLVLASNSSSNKYNWTAGTSAGTKTLTVKVTDSKGKTATASQTITVKAGTNSLNVSLKLNSKVVQPNVVDMLKATATGGSGSYKYTYKITVGSTTKVLAENRTSNEFTWNSGKAGKKTLTVVVTDSKGAKATASVNVEVTSSRLAVVLSANSTKAAKNTTTKIVATAAGGAGLYTYTYTIKVGGKSLVLSKEQYANVYSWYTGKEGTKTLIVTVKDSTGAIATSSMDIVVK